MQNFSIIAACDKNHGIGINNQLPWDLKADLKHFSQITIGNKNNAIIMGYNTWRSLPDKYRPLKDRVNVVLSLEPIADLPAEVPNFQSLDTALEELGKKNFDEIFIIGGGMLYKLSITHPACNKIYLTELEETFNCDVFFPQIPAEFKKIATGDRHEENNTNFRFNIYQK